MGIKRRIIIGLIFILLMIFSFALGLYSVKGSWTTEEPFIEVENVGWFSESWGISSYNNQIFYDNNTDRWYILYAKDYSSADPQIRYSYSDSGDIDTWNNGGTASGMVVRHGARTLQPANAQYAWVYDSDNEIGHLIFARDDSASYWYPANYGLFYRNFTIDEVTGGLTFGDIIAIDQQTSSSCYPAVDVCLSWNNLPIVSYTGIIETGNGDLNGYICDSIDGYGGSWTMFTTDGGLGGGAVTSVIPCGNETAILIQIDSDASNPARYIKVEFGVTSDETATTQLTDSSTLYHAYANSIDDCLGFGVSWNTTHGFVAYCESTNSNGVAFSFDFDTMTTSSEYVYATFNDWSCFNGITVDENEPFATCQESSSYTTYNQSVACTEYHDSLYEGYYNNNSIGYVLEDYGTTWNNYNPHGINTAKFPDNDGNSLIMIAYSDYVYVTYFNPEGEFSPSEGGGYEEPTIDWGWIKYVLLLIVILSIISFAVYIKYWS